MNLDMNRWYGVKFENGERVKIPHEMFTTRTAAEACGVTRLTVRNWILMGVLVDRYSPNERWVRLHASLQGSWWIKRADLIAFLVATGKVREGEIEGAFRRLLFDGNRLRLPD